MKKEYDLSKLKSRKNPYTKRLKQQITMRINSEAVEYFKKLSIELGMPYQNLINNYLTDCAEKQRKLKFDWK
jgi:predicted DNA binding CopG/RHH family protein